MHKFEWQGAQKTKDSEESDKEIRMSNTDMMLSLVTSKPGKSRVFPDENTSPIVDKPKKKKKLMKRKDRKSAQKITENSSEDNEEIAGSTKDVPKETRPIEIKSLVQEICSLPVTEGKNVEDEKMSPSDDNPDNEKSVQEVTNNSVTA